MVINHTKGIGQSIANEVYNLYPDQYVPEKEKYQEKWVKTNLDYFTNLAYSQYTANQKEVVKNYRLLKGILTKEDFYEEDHVISFMDTLSKDMDLPTHVKHYPILNPPINTMIGELSRRPDNHHVKAFDDDSRSEELSARTEMLQQYILENARNKILMKVAEQQGITPEELMQSEEGQQQVQELTEKKISEFMVSYTSTAEKWGNMTLDALKPELNLKEKSEEAFRDLLICSRQFYQILEDNSKLGIDVRVVNPKNVWYLTTPDKKYTKQAYAVGTIDIMEFSEILNTFHLSMEEIDALRKGLEGYETNLGRESNLFNNITGDKSITYDTYDPLVQRERMLLESQVHQNTDALNTILGLGNTVQTFGSKYVVVRAYWLGKKKTGKLTYLDPDTGKPEITLVDETYKKIPEEISIEWGYQNQWWEGIKIGTNVYFAKPYTLLNYPPIIGVVHENKNTEARSLVDLMKPFQVLYNICMNQLFSLFEKELGNVANVSIRRLPKLRDGDDQDAIDAWEMMAKDRGITFDDDSPENTKVPISNQSVARNIDLTRTNEIQSRYNAAVQLKNECWELVGFNRQRLGSVLATETATGTNAALTQSYAQTEPYFAQHEYTLNEFYQAILDAVQTIEQEKPTSTLSYVNNEGTHSFLQVNGSELRLKDLKVFVTSRAEDQRIFNELRMLAQPMLTSGAASLYDVAVLYSTNSVRQIKDTFKRLKEQNDAMQQQQQALEQQKIEQTQAQFEETMKKQEALKREEMINDNYQNELDRLNKKEIAIINSFNRQDDNLKDADSSGVPDILEISRLAMDREAANKNHNTTLSKLNNERIKEDNKMKIEMEKLKQEKEKLKQEKELKLKELETQLTVAKYRDLGTKNSPKSSSKKKSK
jgi:hypothetical protein